MNESLNKEKVIEALKEVYDPEIPVNIADLGLIYDVTLTANDAAIDMENELSRRVRQIAYKTMEEFTDKLINGEYA